MINIELTKRKIKHLTGKRIYISGKMDKDLQLLKIRYKIAEKEFITAGAIHRTSFGEWIQDWAAYDASISIEIEKLIEEYEKYESEDTKQPH